MSAETLVHVVQGDFAVAAEAEIILTAILGSCVAACLRDPVAGVGGMNHFLLPASGDDTANPVFYGAQAMELLINALLKRGARKERLEAKLFGGGRLLGNLSDIGAKNADFARTFLRAEGIACIAESLGGERARRVRFWPHSGRARQALLASRLPVPEPPSRPSFRAGEIELF
jgi:chemotaxis protein CheD